MGELKPLIVAPPAVAEITKFLGRTDLAPIEIRSDAVGMAKETTLSSINGKMPTLTAAGNVPISVSEDAVGVAKETTLASIDGKMPTVTAAGNVPTAVSEDTVGLVKEATLLSVGVEKDVAQPLTAYSIAAGGTVDADIAVPLKRAGVAIILRAIYNSAATAGARVEVYYSPDGTAWDTDTDERYDHPFRAGETVQKSYVLGSVPPHVRIKIVNLDTAYAVTVDLWRVFI